MSISVHTLIGTHERSFQCVTIDQGELSPHDHSGCRLTTLLHSKGAVLETEHVIVFTEEQWEYLLFVPVLLLSLVVSKHEHVTTS